MPKHTFHNELVGVSDSGTEFDQKTEKFPDNVDMCLQHVCVCNHNKNNARANVGVITGQQIMWLGSIICSSDGVYYYEKYNVFFKSARGLIIRWHAINSDDRVEAYIYGYYRD